MLIYKSLNVISINNFFVLVNTYLSTIFPLIFSNLISINKMYLTNTYDI